MARDSASSWLWMTHMDWTPSRREAERFSFSSSAGCLLPLLGSCVGSSGLAGFSGLELFKAVFAERDALD